MKIDRMLTIIVILLNRSRISAKELAEKFEVSVRTIYRDIESINMAGIPIISYSGNNGGFGIKENYKLNHQLLTLNNLCSILSALKGVNSTFEDVELESSIEKLRNIIPQDKIHHLDLHMEQFIIGMQPWAYTSKQKELVKNIRNAITQTQLITIIYRNYTNETSTRQIEPMSLIFKGYTWYLFGYCHLKTNFRVFRISRIIDLQVEDVLFKRREKSYQEIEEASKKQVSLTSITLKFVPQVRSRVEDIFDKENIEILNTGELIVTAHFPEKEWYYGLIFSFGEHVEVLGPERVRQAVASRIKSMLEKYQ
ncbi:YafY family protein [Cytobacillus sp. IB215316]|uniref:helix-turn-helix transcriptional regulator n=1 Tax=Cytobacillus sp. IB215316 TaxID=3097354 RepID=UPI002A150374|nr:YafY family protein [Cytobacillus sp. IB215316]MDX8363230.1 YafY family protein [Cytobacillus sp. IB215316]